MRYGWSSSKGSTWCQRENPDLSRTKRSFSRKWSIDEPGKLFIKLCQREKRGVFLGISSCTDPLNGVSTRSMGADGNFEPPFEVPTWACFKGRYFRYHGMDLVSKKWDGTGGQKIHWTTFWTDLNSNFTTAPTLLKCIRTGMLDQQKYGVCEPGIWPIENCILLQNGSNLIPSGNST